MNITSWCASVSTQKWLEDLINCECQKINENEWKAQEKSFYARHTNSVIRSEEINDAIHDDVTVNFQSDCMDVWNKSYW